MNYDKAHIRHCMLFQFHQSKNASQATKTICSVYGEDALVERTCRYWFARFTAGDLYIQKSNKYIVIYLTIGTIYIVVYMK